MAYKNCDVYLTTKHEKQQVIAPIFAEELAANIVTCDFDTDCLGTFSGEIPRKLSAVEAARQKCLWGLDFPNRYFGLASEGSFGPHPSLHFLPCDREVLYFIDLKRGFNLYETETSLETNYQMQTVSSLDELMSFATKALYPSHGLIVKPNNSNNDPIIYKGLTTDTELIEAFEKSITSSADKKVWVETDMRAHMNPTRMSIISDLSRKLSKRLQSYCMSCGMPGWGVIRLDRGLECSGCGFATELVKYEIFGCIKCDAEQKLHRADSKEYADPTYCNNCNP